MNAGNDNLAAARSQTSSASASQQQAEPRVLVVDPALADQLNHGLLDHCLPGAQVTVVPGFLSALGEVGRTSAGWVIVPIRTMAGMVAAGAKTLRRMTPHSRLLVVADKTEQAEAERALAYGFDAIIHEPINLPALQAACQNHTPPPAAPETMRQAAHEHDTFNASPSLSQRPMMPTTDTTDSTNGQADGDELGDVDLIEAILSGRGLLRRTAMQLLTARSGIVQVAWADPADDVPAGHHTATVACRQHLFGTLHAPPPARQDHLEAWAAWLARWLTLERQVHQLEELSMKDDLTRVWNRRYFNRFLKQVIDRSARDRSQVTLMVFDIDDFKIYNDRYGHAAGDEILRETARLMQSSVREHDVVARIGGDEFAVIFWDAEEKRRADSQHPESVRTAAKRFQQAIYQHRFPKLLNEAPGTLTISGGLASFPWDGRTPQELLEKADEMAMQSKRQGKNAITFGPGALRQCDA